MHLEHFLFYKKCFLILIIFMITVVFTVNCSYQLHTDISDKKLKKCCNIKHVIIRSYDPFGLITKAVYIELYKNKINFSDKLNDDLKKQDIYVYLHIINTSEDHITTSVFSDGTEAGYQLILHIHAKLLTSDKKFYPINIQIRRNFIRNSKNTLFNNTQENDIRQLMYQEAAEKLVFYVDSR